METVNIQCPGCKQPYSVALDDLCEHITEFNCAKCNTDFCCGPLDTNDGFVSTFLKSDLEMEQTQPPEDQDNDASQDNVPQDNVPQDNVPQDNVLQDDDDKARSTLNDKLKGLENINILDEPDPQSETHETSPQAQPETPSIETQLDQPPPKVQQPSQPQVPPPSQMQSQPAEQDLGGDVEGSQSIGVDENVNCPRCGKKNVGKKVSCDFCGVVFEKFRKFMKQKQANKDPIQDFVEKAVVSKTIPQVPDVVEKTKKESVPDSHEEKPEVTKTYIPKQGVEVGEELQAVWDSVKANYDKEKEHQRFIQICLSQDQLAFASGQYRKILDANPNDDIADKMVNKIVGLAMASYVPSPSESLPAFRLGTSGAFALFGLMVVVIGLVPDVHNLFKGAVLPIGILLFIISAGIRVLKR